MTDANTSETPLDFELPTEFRFSNAQNESFTVS